MSMLERMLAGELYHADDAEVQARYAAGQRVLAAFNATGPDEGVRRRELLHELLGEVGEGVIVQPTLRVDYGWNVRIGAGSFLNYDCILLDVAPITIGRDCQIATRVQLLTATHPVDPVVRRAGWESGAPIELGDNVWLGGGVIVLPSVTIGADTVVGAGAVVTRDLPAGVIAVGSPARVLREITEADRVAMPTR